MRPVPVEKREPQGQPAPLPSHATINLIDEKSPADGAFAKLEGRNLFNGDEFVAYITELPVTLGRTIINKPSSPGHIYISSSNQISRLHARIDFDEKQNSFVIEPLGKNKITVRKVIHGTGSADNRIKINSKDPIRIGDVGFYFLRSSTAK